MIRVTTNRAPTSSTWWDQVRVHTRRRWVPATLREPLDRLMLVGEADLEPKVANALRAWAETLRGYEREPLFFGPLTPPEGT